MPARRWSLLGALTFLWILAPLGRDAALGQACGAEPFKAGEPQLDRRERWRYAHGGVGSFVATLVTDEVVVASAFTPGCATELHSIRAFALGTGEELWALTPDELPGGMGSEPQGDGELVFVSGLSFGTGAGGGDEWTLLAVDALTGEKRWTWTTAGQPLVNVVGQAADAVLVLRSDETSALLALDSGTGEVAWELSFAGFGTGGTIDADAGLVYVDGFAPGGIADGLLLLAVGLEGGERWRMDPEGPTSLVLVSVGANGPVIAEYGATGTTVRGLDATSGGERWAVALPAPAVGSAWGIAAAEDLLLAHYVLEAGSTVVALDAATGGERWRVELDVPVSIRNLAASGPVVLGRADLATGLAFGAIALDRDSGAERWRVELPGTSGIVAAGDALYLTAGEPGEGQELHALDPENGAELWNLGFPEFASLAILNLTGDTLLLSGANDDEAALIAVDVT